MSTVYMRTSPFSSHSLVYVLQTKCDAACLSELRGPNEMASKDLQSCSAFTNKSKEQGVISLPPSYINMTMHFFCGRALSTVQTVAKETFFDDVCGKVAKYTRKANSPRVEVTRNRWSLPVLSCKMSNPFLNCESLASKIFPKPLEQVLLSVEVRAARKVPMLIQLQLLIPATSDCTLSLGSHHIEKINWPLLFGCLEAQCRSSNPHEETEFNLGAVTVGAQV
eukprot:5135037-Amphidinium_carterae.2